MLGLIFKPEYGGDVFSRNIDLIFNRLHGVISKKIELLISTAMGTSNPTDKYFHTAVMNG
jgi:hypothetical protein